VAKAVKAAGKRNHLFVCSSTTTPGALDAVLIPMLERELDGVCGRDFGVCYNPEFIALGDVVNGLLPCGLTYTAALAAAALHRVPAATLFMTGFWLGTLPALAIVSISAAALPRIPAARLRWITPVAMTIAGLLLIVRGLEPLRQPAESGPVAAPHHHGL